MEDDIIVWPIYSKSGKLLKDGTFNGVKFGEIWKSCEQYAVKYLKEKGWDK